MKIEAAQRLLASKDEGVEVSFRVAGDGTRDVARLLAALAYLGEIGASRSIIIEDMPLDPDELNMSGYNMNFGFDGDGSDRIRDLTVNGKPYTLDSEG